MILRFFEITDRILWVAIDLALLVGVLTYMSQAGYLGWLKEIIGG